MQSMALADDVRALLQAPVDSDLADRIKKLIASELRLVDDTLQIRTTQFFNHTQIPDIILEWKEQGRAHQRHLYVRLGIDGPSLALDTDALAGSGSVVLAAVVDQQDTVLPSSKPSSLPDEGMLLLLTAGAIRVLQAADDYGSLNRRLPTAVIRGGIGVIDSRAAESLLLLCDTASTAISRLNVAGLRDAASSFLARFKPTEAARIAGYMAELWEQAGGAADDLPEPLAERLPKMTPGGLTVSAQRGGVPISEVSVLRDEDGPSVEASVLDDLDEIDLAENWEGFVVDVTEDGFVGMVVDLNGTIPDSEVAFRIDELSLSDREHLQAGSIFRWSVRSGDSPVGRTTISTIAVVPPVAPSSDQRSIGERWAWETLGVFEDP